MSSDGVALLSVDDLHDDEVVELLADARRFIDDRAARHYLAGRTVGLLFLSPSLRSRTGYAVAAARLGASSVDICEARDGVGMTTAESFSDTLRCVSGMVDLVVLRVPFSLDRREVAANRVGPVVNAGGGGLGGEHPTQALIDLFVIEHERGPIGTLRVTVCGDLTARSAHSLLKLFARFPPRSLTLVAPRGREDAVGVAADRTDRLDVRHCDVLYLPGLPEGVGSDALGENERAAYALTAARLDDLPADAVVLSPMPVIDEITPTARLDKRVRIHAQSDAGVAVRMAVLRRLLSG